VSEYFKNALKLGSNLAQETPSSAFHLKDFKDQHIKDLNDKLNDDGFPKEEESVYHGHWRFSVSLFFVLSLIIFSRILLKMQYRGHGLLEHVCVSHVSS
jgi:hypothetical protein